MQKSINEQYNVLIESRLTKLETLIASHEKTFDSMESRFIRLETKIDKHFFWTIGLIVGSILIPYLNAYLRYKGVAV